MNYRGYGLSTGGLCLRPSRSPSPVMTFQKGAHLGFYITFGRIGLRIRNSWLLCAGSYPQRRWDVPVGVPLDLSTPVMEWHELPKYNGIQVSQLIYPHRSDISCAISVKSLHITQTRPCNILQFFTAIKTIIF